MLLKDRKAILIPVEEIVRELDYKLILAVLLARPSNQIFIGNHTDIYEFGKQLQGGLYVGKNVLNVSPTRLTECYEHLKQRQFRVIFLDEEGAFFQGGQEQWKKRLSSRLDPNWMQEEDTLCTWGDFQTRHYSDQVKGKGPKIVTTGHPRFSLSHPDYAYLYKEEIDKLKSKYGRFILFNTNFKYANHMHGADYYFQLNSIAPEDQEQRDYFLAFWAHTQRRLVSFIELVNEISNRFPDYQIVLRPHQAESEACYKQWFAHIPRTHVTHEGRLQAWLHAAEALVHDGCTTGVEAWVGRKRVVVYHPHDDERFNFDIPNKLGAYCRTSQEAIEAFTTKAVEAQGEDVDAVLDLLANLKEPESAFKTLCGLVHETEAEMSMTEVVGNLAPFKSRGTREKIKKALRATFRPLIGPYKPRNPFVYQRFPGLDQSLIDSRLNALSHLNPDKIQWQLYSSKLMTVHTS